MAERTPNRVRTDPRADGRAPEPSRQRTRKTTDGRLASRAEMDALGEVIAATIALAARARSEAAAALLERALTTLRDRSGAGDGPGTDGSTRATFNGP